MSNAVRPTFEECLDADGTLDLEKLINPHPRQQEFLKAIYRYRRVFYGGARGGGKSYLLRWALVHFLFWCTSLGLRNVRVGLFCATYVELWNRQIVKCVTEFEPHFGKFNEKHMEFRFKAEWGGHIIQFCNIADPTAYQSAEFAAIAIDEITLIPDIGEVLTILGGSLRWPGLPWSPLFTASNPTGPGHSYCKRLWIDRDFTAPEDRNKDPEQYKYIKCLPTDNPHLPPEYIKNELETIPDHLREPWLHGSWDIVAGQRFDRFRHHVHVIEGYDTWEQRRAYVEARGEVAYYRSVDWGTFDPMGMGIYAVVNRRESNGDQRIEVYMMYEHCEKGMNSRMQAICVRENTPSWMRIAEPTFLDNQAWEEEADGLSGAAKFFQEGVPVQQVMKSRAMGWDALDDVLYWECKRNEDGTLDHSVVVKEPILKFFSCCHLTIQQLQGAMWDPKKPKDILHPRSFRDDMLDQLRYFILTHIKAPARTVKSEWHEQQRIIETAMNAAPRKLQALRRKLAWTPSLRQR